LKQIKQKKPVDFPKRKKKTISNIINYYKRFG